MQLSGDARARFEEWLQENQLLQEGLGSIEPALEAHVAKYAAMALRITLTFHAAQVVNHEHPEARDPAAFSIPLTTLQQALAFLKRATQHAIVVYLNRKGASQAYEIAQAIARFVIARTVEENNRGLARRDILRRVSAYRDSADERDQARALDLLIDMAWLREAEGGYQKAAPTRYAVNPALATKYADLALRERARRTLVREQIAEAAEQQRKQRTDTR